MDQSDLDLRPPAIAMIQVQAWIFEGVWGLGLLLVGLLIGLSVCLLVVCPFVGVGWAFSQDVLCEPDAQVFT